MAEILKQKFMLRIDNLEARLTTKHLIGNPTDEDYTVDIIGPVAAHIHSMYEWAGPIPEPAEAVLKSER